MTKEIPLTKGLIAIVDDDDYIKLKKYNWYATMNHKNGTWYAKRNIVTNSGKCTTITMHRQLLDSPKMIDHINQNGLDNRRSNLRVCNRSQNQWNGKKRKSASGFRGVREQRNKFGVSWHTYIWKNGKIIYVGSFDDKMKAAIAYDTKAIELFGKDFATLNFPES